MSKGGVLVQIRLQPEEAAELKAAADAAGRTLPGEMRHRLNYDGGTSRSRALADLMAIIAARAEAYMRPIETDHADANRKRLLGVVKQAIDSVLDALLADGGKETEPEPKLGELPISKGITWDMASWISMGDVLYGPDDTPDQRTLARIGAALGFADKPQKPSTKRSK
jgi:hypothetical protein